MNNHPDGLPHRPVLYNEIILALQPARGGRYVDCTLGAGGHAWGILEKSAPDGLLLGLEVDPVAFRLAQQRLEAFGGRAILLRESYLTLSEQVRKLGWSSVNGILFDLGLSSIQLDTPSKGFSFSSDAPLDMRFDPDAPQTAADLVNTLSEQELADLLYQYGEETRSRQIARAIVRSRPINRTVELADLVVAVMNKERRNAMRTGSRKDRIHPATRTFQALRIVVNHELEAVKDVLPQAVDALGLGGRLAVISFHSLEDRIVKQFFRQESRDCLCPARQPVCTCGHQAVIKEIARHPVRPAADEVQINPRGRSARLRVVEKIR